MNIHSFAQVIAAVTSGSSFGGDMPCKNEKYLKLLFVSLVTQKKCNPSRLTKSMKLLNA
jgi:hypothetical protein